MKRSNQRPPLSEVQMEIMNIVWERGEITVGDLWQELSLRRPVARNTVLTHMMRLEEKGWLLRRANGNLFQYSAAVERAGVLGQMVSRLVDTAFAGSAEGLVMSLLDGRGITKKEAARIRTLIEKSG